MVQMKVNSFIAAALIIDLRLGNGIIAIINGRPRRP